jgi:hypothetical protein
MIQWITLKNQYAGMNFWITVRIQYVGKDIFENLEKTSKFLIAATLLGWYLRRLISSKTRRS